MAEMITSNNIPLAFHTDTFIHSIANHTHRHTNSSDSLFAASCPSLLQVHFHASIQPDAMKTFPKYPTAPIPNSWSYYAIEPWIVHDETKTKYGEVDDGARGGTIAVSGHLLCCFFCCLSCKDKNKLCEQNHHNKFTGLSQCSGQTKSATANKIHIQKAGY